MTLSPAAAPTWTRAHLRPGEEPLWWGRPSLVGVVPILTSLVLTAAALILSFRYGFNRPGLLLTGVPALAVTLVGILAQSARRLVRLRSTSYVVTRDRLYVITSRLTSEVQALPLSRITRASMRQGPIGRTLGYWTGDVRAFGADAAHVQIPAIRDGPGLLSQLDEALARSANANWLLRGD